MRWWGLWLVVGMLVAVGVVPSRADSVTNADWNGFLSAVEKSPVVVAARERQVGAGAGLTGAGRLENPTVEAGYAERQTPEGDVPMWEFVAAQPLSARGARSAERRQAAATHRVVSREYALIAAETAAETARWLAGVETARRELALLSRQRLQAEQVLAAEDGRIAAGRGALSGRLALERYGLGLQQRIVSATQRAADAEAAAVALLGIDSPASLPAYAAPQLFSDPPSAAVGAPAVALAEARADEAGAMADLAVAEGRPMTAVAVRGEREEMESGDEDTLGVVLMTELPWGGRARARAASAAARADREASHAEAEAARRTLLAEREQAQRAEQVAADTRALAAETESRLAAEYDAWLGKAGLAEGGESEASLRLLLDILEKQTEARLEVVEAEGAAREARAALWRQLPADVFGLEEDDP